MPSAVSLFSKRSPIPRASFIHLSKSPVDESPSRLPSGAPMEINARLQSLFYLSSRVPSQGALLPGSIHRAPIERDAPHPELLSAISQIPRRLTHSRLPI
jgi:hypothetical protein